MNELEKAAREYCDSVLKVTGHYSDPENAFQVGAQWQAKQSPWISVEDKLPDTDNGQSLCNVIIKFDDGSYYIVANIDVEDMAKVGGATHWMPIPE